MTDNIGEQMTDEELYAAQPAKDFEFNLEDTIPARKTSRKVVVPNWMAREGRWSELWGTLDAARAGNMALAAERLVKAMEFARQVGIEEARGMIETVRTVEEREYEAALRRSVEQRASIQRLGYQEDDPDMRKALG